MPFRYRLLPVALDAYGPDFYTTKIDDGAVFDPENPSSVAGIQSNNSTVTAKYLGGMGLLLPFSVLPVTPRTGDEWAVNIQNVTTYDPSAVVDFLQTIDTGRNSQDVREFLGMPSLEILGAGVIEINSTFKSVSTNSIYLFQPKQISLVLT